MSDRMVSCVRLFAFRKDISMNNKDRKRQIAYEVLMILVSLALLTFICRLWPILLLIILGIFVAAIRLLFLSGNRVDQVEPQPLLPAPIPAPTESDLRKLAHSLITSRITTLVLNEYPNARWIWEAPNAFELIELGEEVYILLNRAGGYRKAKVIIQNLQVIGLQYQEISKKPDESEERTEAPATEQPKENYELIAFEWAESHIFELNARCNDAIGQGSTIVQPGVLVGLNSLLEQSGSITLPTGEVIQRHPDAVVVVTTNTSYEGCRGMNQSVLDRMSLVRDVELPSPEVMAQRAMSVTGATDEYEVSKMVQVVNDLAEYCRKNSITDGSYGMRSLIDWIISSEITGDVYESALYTIISKATADELDREALISTVLEPIFAPKRHKASA